MGYSGWHHIDFQIIREEDKSTLEIIGEDGKVYSIPKKFVADVRDYKKGDKNGTISVKDNYAARRGWIK